MGIMDKILGKGEAPEASNIEDMLDEQSDVVNPPADFYVKTIDLRNDGDVDNTIKELSEKNIIILNVLPLSKQPNRLKTIIGKLKSYVSKMNGDIAMIPPDRIILTPAKVKIVKSKPKAKPSV
ncbi:Cell division protein SepF [uncultured archaeon]|nr:Cell division protein SepF [uncultured archaeon]